MRKLQQHQRKNGYDYELIERDEKFAIYRQIDSYKEECEMTIAYEVFIIRSRKDRKIKGNFIEGGEVFPSNEDFGKYAWCYSTFCGTDTEDALSRAYNKFNNLKKEEEENVDK